MTGSERRRIRRENRKLYKAEVRRLKQTARYAVFLDYDVNPNWGEFLLEFGIALRPVHDRLMSAYESLGDAMEYVKCRPSLRLYILDRQENKKLDKK